MSGDVLLRRNSLVPRPRGIGGLDADLVVTQDLGAVCAVCVLEFGTLEFRYHETHPLLQLTMAHKEH